MGEARTAEVLVGKSWVQTWPLWSLDSLKKLSWVHFTKSQWRSLRNGEVFDHQFFSDSSWIALFVQKPRRIILLSLFWYMTETLLLLFGFFLNWKCNSAPFAFDHDGESSIYLLLVCAQWIPLTSQFGFKSKKGSFGNIFLQWIYKVILVLFIQQMFALWNVKLELTSPPFNVTAQHLFVEKAIHVALGISYVILYKILTIELSSIVSKLMTVTWKRTSVAFPEKKEIFVAFLLK